MRKYRYKNGKRVNRVNAFDNTKICVNVNISTVPDRAYTLEDLSNRLANGLPMPRITFYQIYEDTGMNKPPIVNDLLGVSRLEKQLDSNLKHIQNEKDKAYKEKLEASKKAQAVTQKDNMVSVE